MTFTNYTCWTTAEIDAFVRREALEGDEATFLGAHLPIDDFDLLEGHLSSHDERSLLEDLIKPRKHAVVLVEGEPGSGKSHLIQWLRYRWPRVETDHPVLVPRSDGSLLGTLTRLRIKLGPPYSDVLTNLGGAVSLALEGQANAFLGQLVTYSLGKSFGAEDEKPVHADWLDHFQVWRILNQDVLRESWKAPRDIVRILSGADGERDQQRARFTAAHILELVELVLGAKVDRNLGNFKAQRLFVNLQEERTALQRIIGESRTEAEQFERLRLEAPTARQLIDALDARCEYAVQGLLGIQRDELKNKMLDVRRRLAKDGRRLVLLLEDITNLQGVDRQLIESLLPSSASSEDADLCDLVAVVGVTTDYRDKFLNEGNIRERLRFHIRMTSEEQERVTLRTTRFLSDPGRRARFVASYLNAVRLGRSTLKTWASGDNRARPNQCADCAHAETCHRVFGAVEVPNVGGGRVGLYPLTPHVLEQQWERLRDSQGTRTLHTPRGLLLNVVSGMLHGQKSLENGEFPPSEIEGANLRPPEPSADVQDALLATPVFDRDRLRRAIVWWGDAHDGYKKELGGTAVSYSGVPAGVMAAFSLPWKNEGVVEAPAGLAREPIVEQVPTIADDPGTRSDAGSKPPSSKNGTPETASTPGFPVDSTSTDVVNPHPPPHQAMRLPPEWDRNIESLNAWRGGKRLEQAGAWEGLLHRAIKNLKAEPLGLPAWLWDRVFTAENVTLEGVKGSESSLHFVLPRGGVVQRGLTALAWLTHGVEMTESATARRYAEACNFQTWLADRAREHIERVSAQIQDSVGANPVSTAVQILVAGAWLNGLTTPKDAAADQWSAAVGPIGEVAASLTSQFGKLAHACHNLRGEVLRVCLDGLRVGQPPQKPDAPRLLSGRDIFDAVEDIVHAPSSWPTGTGSLPKKLSFLDVIAKLAGDLYEEIEESTKDEYERLLEITLAIERETDKKDSEAFLEDASLVLEEVRGIDSSLVPMAIASAWTSALSKLHTAGLGKGSARQRSLDDSLCELVDEMDEMLAARLARIASVRRDDLLLVQAAVDAAARATRECYDRASEWIDSPIDSERAESISKAAKTIVEVAKALQAKTRGKHAC